MINLGDIKKIHADDVEPVDLVVGGSPCQNLSISGNRTGISGLQSSLFYEQIRLLKEMRLKYRKPDFFIWENVHGALIINGGREFSEILIQFVKLLNGEDTPDLPRINRWPISGAISGQSWSISWRCHNAKFWGVPQNRRRISIVCDFTRKRAAQILFEQESKRWDKEEGWSSERNYNACFGMNADASAKNISVLSETSHSIKTTTRECVVYGLGCGQKNDMNPIKETSHCLTASHDQNLITNGLFIRRLTPLECERLQGFPDGWTDVPGASDRSRYKVLGNSIAIPFWQFLLERIIPHCENRTMGSLFNGIGGFPVIWKRCGGETLWVSEIDNFCDKVMRKNFKEYKNKE